MNGRRTSPFKSKTETTSSVPATAIILAGGRSRRMDYHDKALLHYRGQSFIEIALQNVRDFDDIMIVSRSETDYSFAGVRTIADSRKDCGPLCGIYTGLLEAHHQVCVVLSVDTPFIKPDLLKALAGMGETYDVAIPMLDTYPQPLCAAYANTCLPVMQAALDRGRYKIKDLFQSLNVYYMSMDELGQFGTIDQMFRNINTPEDYQSLLIEEEEM